MPHDVARGVQPLGAQGRAWRLDRSELLLSLFSVGPLVLSLWSGRLADRHGFHLPMGISATLALAGTLVAGLYQALKPSLCVRCSMVPR